MKKTLYLNLLSVFAFATPQTFASLNAGSMPAISAETKMAEQIAYTKTAAKSLLPAHFQRALDEAFLIKKGSATAPVIVEFFDAGCSYCVEAFERLKPLLESDWDVTFYMRPINALNSPESLLVHYGFEQVEETERLAYLQQIFEKNQGLLGVRLTEPAVLDVLNEFDIQLSRDTSSQIAYEAWVEKTIARDKELIEQGVLGVPFFAVFSEDTAQKQAFTEESLHFFISSIELPEMLEKIQALQSATKAK